MGLFSAIGEFLDGVCSIIVGVIGALIATAIFAVGAVIELAIDVLTWIDRELFLSEGSTEVNIIRGSAIADYIKICQANGNYTEVSFEDVQAMRTGVVNVANNDEDIQRMQMVRSQDGLSSSANAQFKGKDVLKIKIG